MRPLGPIVQPPLEGIERECVRSPIVRPHRDHWAVDAPSMLISSVAGLMHWFDMRDPTGLYDGLNGENGLALDAGPVGVWNDRQPFAGGTFAAGMAAQPNMIVNGDAGTGDTTGWTVNQASPVAIVDGAFQITRPGSAAVGFSQNVIEVGKSYLFDFEVIAANNPGVFRFGGLQIVSLTAGSYQYIRTATNTDTNFWPNVQSTLTLNNIRARFIPNAPLVAPATSQQPVYDASADALVFTAANSHQLSVPFEGGAGPANATVIYVSGSDLVEETGRNLSGASSFTVPGDLSSWGARTDLNALIIADASASGHNGAALKSAVASKYGATEP